MRHNGCTGFTDRLSILPQRCRRPLLAAALTFLLLVPSISVSAAQTSTSRYRDHVYLLRGAFNVFSLGMDEIASKLQRQGINATVYNYLAWPQLAEEAAAEYKSGRVRTIILVGHSSGAMAVTSMAARLGQLGVPVKLAIGLDPTTREAVSGNVSRYINYYVANGLGERVDRSRQFSGVLENVDVEKNPNIGHFNIDKNEALQERVIREIRAAL
jgi:pimeloyl-ACP methyl ester carboxylesterase